MSPMAPKLSDVEHMVRPEPRAPGWKGARDLGPHAQPTLELDGMALAVVEANGLDAREGVERMSEADGRILPAREQHQGSIVSRGHRLLPS